MAFEKGKIACLAAGIVSGFGTALCISQLREFIREKCTRKPFSRMEDSIRLEDLEVLVRSPNFSLRKSAEQVLLDRAMKKPNLEFIIKACYSQDEFQVLKAVVVLTMMINDSEHADRERMLEHGILESLSHCLVRSVNSGYGDLVQMGGHDFQLQRFASESLFHLIFDEDEAKIRLARCNSSIIRILLRLISETPNKEVMRWCLFAVHQLAACESLRPVLVTNQVTPVVSEMLVRNQGDLVLMRTCLHTLVMFVNNNTEDEVELLKEMAKHGVIRTAVVCLRADDSDLVYWSTGLLHQFAVQDVHKGDICSMPNIVRSFQTVLCSSEALLQRLVLRVLNFLCVGNQGFRSGLLQCSSLIARFPTCLASGDSDIVHWAVALLHDLLLSEGTSTSNRLAAERVVAVNNNIIKSLVPLALRKDNILIRLVAELLGLFCSIESLQNKVIEDSVLKAVLAFSISEDSDLQFWASALLLNMAMSSDEVKKEIIRLGGLKPLMELAINDSGHPQCASQAAKTLVMLGFLGVNIPVVIKSYGYKNGDYVSISIDSKELCPNKPGVNVVVMDFLTFQVTDMMSFDTGHDVLASEYLVEFIEMVPVGALVFMAVRGEANFYMTDQAKACLSGIGLENYDFKTGELWAFCSYKKRDEGEQISLARGFDAVELEASIKLGDFVNEQVLENILFPLIDLLLSTPASLAISKVSELELLTILARHDDHRRVMVNSDGLMEYVVELIDNMASKPAHHLRLNPLVIAHCIGAMKIVTAISVAQESHEKIAEHNVLDAILRLLYLINSVELGQLQETSAGTKEGVDVIVETVTSPDDDDDGVLTNPEGQPLDPSVATPSENVSAMAKEVHLTASGLRSPVFAGMDNNTPVTSAQLKGTSLTTVQPKALQSETVSGEVVVHDDLDEAFTSLTGLAVIALYNCLDLVTSFEESREHFLQSGAVQILWCRLLTAGACAAQQIGLATEMLLNSCCCMTMLEKYYPEILVELDEQTKTPALLLSADRLEVCNPNWTFESVRATFCVGRGMSAVPPYPAGWYYEVILKSSGILQIGWQNEDCRYGPERGVGVGDDTNSCAFDGARCKVWNGPPSEQRNNDYGREWSNGDVLSCLFSWNGEVSFWLNGVDMGVAFRELNPLVNWYPAASIAMDQHCCFNFGGKPFRYDMPDGYIAASQVVNNLFKKLPLRLSSCWTPISGSFESIVEEDEENSQEDLGESETSRVPTENTAEKPRSRLSQEDSGVSTEKERRQSNLSLRELIDREPSLVSTPAGVTNSFTFVTPISSLSSSPLGTSPQSIAYDSSFSQARTDQSQLVNESQYEEKPPFEEKCMTSTPYLGEMVMEKSIVKHFEQPRPVTRRGCGRQEEPFIDESEPANPFLYFESELRNAPCRVKQMGFINVETKERIYCDIHDGHLHLPHSSCPAAHEQESYRVPDVVGCAVTLSTGQVMFTLDGVGTGQFYDFPSCKSSSMVVKNLFPYISCSRIRCNYGQRPFLFERANRKTFTLASGILMDIS